MRPDYRAGVTHITKIDKEGPRQMMKKPKEITGGRNRPETKSMSDRKLEMTGGERML